MGYATLRREHLALHPFCQLTIAMHRLREEDVLTANRSYINGVSYNGVWIPRATQIHHRNKCQGARLTDARWFSSASPKMHQWVEDHKDEARRDGYLLPINADPDGFMPDGSCGLTTDEWLLVRAKNAVDGMG